MTTMFDPTRIVISWMRDVMATAGTDIRVTVDVNPARDLPQLLVAPVVATSVPDGPGGSTDRVRARWQITVSAIAEGGERPDHNGAFTAIRPVLNELQRVTATPGGWVALTGERIISTTAVRHTPSVGAADQTARSTVSFEATVLVPVIA